MSQLVRTTNQLIVDSLYLVGELGVDETPDAFMYERGISLINELLEKFASDSIYIPFLTTISSQFNVGQDTYSISDMVPADITQDRIVDLSFANYVVPASGIIPGPQTSNFITNFQVNNQLIITQGFSFTTGTPVQVQVFPSGTLPAPLQPLTVYYAINVDASHIILAASLSDANVGIGIILTSNGSTTGTFSVTSQTSPAPQPTVTSLVYPLRIINKATYWNVVRQTNLLARPGFIFLNKQATESFITVYPVPDQPYQFSIQAKCMINQLTNQSTLIELPPNYYRFMKYALGRDWIAYYPSANWPQTNESEYWDMYDTVKPTNETDLTLRPSVTLTAPEPFYWPNILSY